MGVHWGDQRLGKREDFPVRAIFSNYKENLNSNRRKTKFWGALRADVPNTRCQVRLRARISVSGVGRDSKG